MTEKEIKGLILVFSETVRQEKNGLISDKEAYEYIKKRVEIVASVIKEELINKARS